MNRTRSPVLSCHSRLPKESVWRLGENLMFSWLITCLKVLLSYLKKVLPVNK